MQAIPHARRNENMTSTPPPSPPFPTGNTLFQRTVLMQGSDHSKKVWDFLSVPDRWNLPLLSKTIQRSLAHVEYDQCRDGRTYTVPFPGYPGVAVAFASSPPSMNSAAGLCPSQLACLRAMGAKEKRPKDDSGALRGGILAGGATTSPGHTRTTVLALVASTAGARPNSLPPGETDAICEEGWKWRRQSSDFKVDILKALRPILLWMDEQGGDLSTEQMETLQDEIEAPSAGSRFDTLQKLEKFVHQSVQEMKIPGSVREHVRQNVLELKCSLDKKRRKGRTNIEEQRQDWERTLRPSIGTLIVVSDDSAVKEWGLHILRTMNLALFADRGNVNVKDGVPRGLVYMDGYGDVADLAHDGKAHPDVAIPRRADRPPSWELEKYLIVVTSFALCECAMLSEAAANGGCDGPGRRKRGRDDGIPWMKTTSLSQLRWLRLVVAEEGHCCSLDAWSGDFARFVHRVAAERRWVVGAGAAAACDSRDGTCCICDPLECLKRHLLALRHPTHGMSADDLETGPEDRAKYLLSVGDDRYDEVMSHREMLYHLDRDPGEERLWSFERLDGHDGPLLPGHPSYMGCPWNVHVIWQGGAATSWEPLSVVARDDPLSCAAYARDQGLLDTGFWEEILRDAKTRHHGSVACTAPTHMTTLSELDAGLRSKDANSRDALLSLLQGIVVTPHQPGRCSSNAPRQEGEGPFFSLASIYRQIRGHCVSDCAIHPAESSS